MKLLLYPFLLLALFTACDNRSQTTNTDFQINYINPSIKGHLYRIYTYNNLIIGMFFDHKFFVIDTNYSHATDIENKLNSLENVMDVQFYKDLLLVLSDDRKVFVFDSAFNRKMDVETNFNRLKPISLFYIQDSFYVFDSKDFYLVKRDYNTTLIDSTTFFNSHNTISSAFSPSVYSDNNYNAYACGNGEFGGIVFFQNKKTHQTYYLPTYFSELHYYKGAYHLIHNIDSWSKYIRIEDPTKLYRSTNAIQPPFCCNCDSGYTEYFYKMSEAQRQQWDQKRGVTTYFDTNRIQTITTFLSDDNLYSLCMTDSAFLILQHTDDAVKFIKSVPKLNKQAGSYQAIMKADNKQKQIIGLNGTYWELLDSAGHDRQIDRLGLIVIEGHKINIYESYDEKLVKAERISN